MRLRITRHPIGEVDGFDLRRFQPGQIYDVGTTLANLLLAEGWAVPIDELSEPALVIPLSQVSTRTVLVVDDDADIRAMLNHLLSHVGLAVIEAENGRDALVALVKHRPALILLDLRMPGMDGQQFREAQARLQDRVLAKTPILLISAAENAREMARRLGAAGLFEKPLDFDRLLAVVQMTVRQRTA